MLARRRRRRSTFVGSFVRSRSSRQSSHQFSFSKAASRHVYKSLLCFSSIYNTIGSAHIFVPPPAVSQYRTDQHQYTEQSPDAPFTVASLSLHWPLVEVSHYSNAFVRTRTRGFIPPYLSSCCCSCMFKCSRNETLKHALLVPSVHFTTLHFEVPVQPPPLQLWSA